MRHLTISSFGHALGVSGNRLVVTDADGKRWETALSRLRTIRIEKPGVSISSNLLLACAARGIRLYLTDWRGVGVAAVSGLHQHAVVAVREAQFRCLDSTAGQPIAREIISTKIRNQRAVLLYFGKYLSKTRPEDHLRLKTAAETMARLASDAARLLENPDAAVWRNMLMGLEGAAAEAYWRTLREVQLVPPSFSGREGRGSLEICNAALNYGYAILQSYVWSALDNAGLELYAGLLHVPRPGKPSLVLDLMEEYRAWVVDRNVIKLRKRLESDGARGLTPALKKLISESIDETMATTLTWHDKSVRLENILQRQCYRLAGSIAEGKAYRGVRFKW